ncbi:hypothetical protein ACQ4PT_039148 [Festuca glaucescens]
MDLSMTNLWLQGKEDMDVSFSQAEPAAINCRNEDLDVTAVNSDCLGSSEAVEASGKSFNQRNQIVPDDDSKLVLGLGPMPNLYSADSHSSGGNKVKLSATLFAHCTTTDHGLVLGISRGSSRNLQPTIVPGSNEHSHKRKNGKFLPLIDEGSTSARRKLGEYVPPLLFAPRSNDICLNGTPSEADVQQHLGTRYEADHDRYLNQHEVQLSPEPSATTDCSFAETSDTTAETSDTIACTSNGEQRSHQRHLKKCRFNGCSKGGRGASGLCISHGGGQRCQKPGCYKGAESRTAYCKGHGGGRRCQELGCTKSAEGKTEFCIAHGGGLRCGVQECSRAARGRSGLCIKHGGGKRCIMEGCTRSAEGYPGLCISHGGGRRCQYPDCGKGAQGGTMFCKSHGGGKRCISEGCTRGAEGSTMLCKGHGGGKRCLFEGDTACPKSVHGGTSFCVVHGGGKRCAAPGCTKSARGRTDCCVRHGGGRRCKSVGCHKSAQGSTDFCKAHGGGKRCAWSKGCEKFARGRSGLCSAHETLMASKEEPEYGQGTRMIGYGVFSGIGSSSWTAGSSMDHGISSSVPGASSDCGESLQDMPSGRLIPPQLLVPGSLKPSSFNLAGNGQEGGEGSRNQSFGLVVPEGRVHGGGLMSMLGGAGGNSIHITIAVCCHRYDDPEDKIGFQIYTGNKVGIQPPCGHDWWIRGSGEQPVEEEEDGTRSHGDGSVGLPHGRHGGDPAAAPAELPAAGPPRVSALARRGQRLHHGDAEPRQGPPLEPEHLRRLRRRRPVAVVNGNLQRELWRRRDGGNDGDVQLVATCNGLLCLCDDKEIGGVITLVNPATGETLPLPPLPYAGRFIGLHHQNRWHSAYSFACHPTSGRYKVVHVPCIFGHVCEFVGMRVLTLGQMSWREVPVGHEHGGASCNLSAGVISIDGATHWVTVGAATKVVSLDLEDERIISVVALPVAPAGPHHYHLTEVHGRLGIFICDPSVTTGVWVMEEEGRRWSRRYSLRGQCVPRPHFVYGEYVLTRERTSVYGHYRRKGSLLPGDVVRVSQRGEATFVANRSASASASNGEEECAVEA